MGVEGLGGIESASTETHSPGRIRVVMMVEEYEERDKLKLRTKRESLQLKK